MKLDPNRVLAKYKNKKEVDKADGSGKTTVYEYGPIQQSNRNKDKAKRVEKLRKSIGKLRSKYKKDLSSSDPQKRLTALAVALIDNTYERVGNPESAKDGHFGVTGWLKKHVTVKGNKATFKYVGKSGVKHDKTIEDKALVSALKKALDGKGAEDKVLCDGGDCTITASEVNEYLKEFGVTAKDIRGLHANEEVRAALKKIRSEGPKLPTPRKERDPILKQELADALEIAAAAVGHEASTLKSQYLVPGMVDRFLHDGTVLDKLDKEATTAPRYASFAEYAQAKLAQDAEVWAHQVKESGLTEPEYRQQVVRKLLKRFASERQAKTLGTQVFLMRPGQNFQYQTLRKKFKPKVARFKPREAFWTSTLAGNASPWLDWCKGEMPEWIGEKAVLLDPSPSADLMVIDSKKDYLFELVYPFAYIDPVTFEQDDYEEEGSDIRIDWSEVAKFYDGVHVTARGAQFVEGWMIESTAWFDATKLKNPRIVDVSNRCQLRLAKQAAGMGGVYDNLQLMGAGQDRPRYADPAWKYFPLYKEAYNLLARIAAFSHGARTKFKDDLEAQAAKNLLGRAYQKMSSAFLDGIEPSMKQFRKNPSVEPRWDYFLRLMGEADEALHEATELWSGWGLQALSFKLLKFLRHAEAVRKGSARPAGWRFAHLKLADLFPLKLRSPFHQQVEDLSRVTKALAAEAATEGADRAARKLEELYRQFRQVIEGYIKPRQGKYPDLPGVEFIRLFRRIDDTAEDVRDLWDNEEAQLLSYRVGDLTRQVANYAVKFASTNQKLVESPHNFHPVKVEPPKAKRKEYPFEGYIDFQGIKIDVENKKGSTRSGTDPDGNPWSVKMICHYGEIRGTEGTDGDKLDVYVGDNHDSSLVVVVHQHNPWDGKYDEDKVLLGFNSEEEAIGAYKNQYSKPGYYKEGEVTTMPIGQFWRWVNEKQNKGKKVKASLSAQLAEAWFRQGTLSEGEKDDREAEKLVQQSPKKKPPRMDLRNRKVDTERDEDPDDKQDKKDRSQNYKDAALYKSRNQASQDEQRALEVPTPAPFDRSYPYAPPPGDSFARREMEYLMGLVPQRDQNLTLVEQADRDFLVLFEDICGQFGCPFDETACRKILSESAIAITKLKWLYNRERPYQFAERHGIPFEALPSKTAHTPAYPSGHTIQAYLIASHLSGISPQHRQEFMNLADWISWSRILAGYHWPSDCTFGKSIFQHMVSPSMPSAVRVARLAAKVPDWAEGKKYTSEETGNKVDFGSLPESQQEKLRQQNEEAPEKETSKEDEAPNGDESSEDDLDRYFTERKKYTTRTLKGVPEEFRDKTREVLDSFGADEYEEFKEQFSNASSSLVRGGTPDSPQLRKALKEMTAQVQKGSVKDSATLAEGLALMAYYENVLDNPAVDLEDPFPPKGEPSSEESKKAAAERTLTSVDSYKKLDAETRQRHWERLEEKIQGLPEDSAQRDHLEAVQRGIGMASAIRDGDKASGVASSMARLVQAADKAGSLEKLTGLSMYGGSSLEDQRVMRSIYEDLTDQDLEDLLPEDHPGASLVQFLADPERSGYLSDEDRNEIRQHVIDLMQAETAFLDPAVTKEVGREALVADHKKAAKKARAKASPKRKMSDLRSKRGYLSWIQEYLKNLITATGKQASDLHRN